MQKQRCAGFVTRDVDTWMNENGLTSFTFASAIRYSPGAVSKWRQNLTSPTERAEKAILRAQKRRGWTPFPTKHVASV